MTRPRKGRRVAFAKDDTAPSQDDKIAGLRFTIEPAHGGSVVLDFVDLKPRRLALAFAKTLRSMGQAGGALGARSTIKQHACAYRIFFAYLAETGARVRGP